MRYLFQDLSLDADRRELHRGTKQVAVEPQVLDLLLYLIRNRERVVRRDEIFDAVWQGRTVSESALSTRINAARSAIGDDGRAQRLIRTHLRKGFRFVGGVHEEPRQVMLSATTSASKPSIAVLPFINMSGDPKQGYFIDGVVEDIITELSRFPELFVIARNSSFTYKGKAVDVRDVGRVLGVRYVLEGSLRKHRSRIRVTGQLIDASSGSHIWADRFEATLKDIFALQVEIAHSVVGAIAPRLEQSEIDRARQKPTEHLSGYDCFLRGMAGWHDWSRSGHDEALKLFYRASEIDPDFARPYALASACYLMRKANGWIRNRKEEISETERLARLGADRARGDAVALCWSGHAIAHVVGDITTGLTLVDRALQLNPNLAVAWQRSGWLRIYAGECKLAIDHIERATRLNPADPLMHLALSARAFAHLLLEEFEEACEFARRALTLQSEWPAALRVLAMSHAMVGRNDAAGKAIARLIKQQPQLRLSNLHEQIFLHRAEHMTMYVRAMRKAGLPQ